MPVSESGEESPFLFHLGDLAHPEAKRRGPVADLLLARAHQSAPLRGASGDASAVVIDSAYRLHGGGSASITIAALECCICMNEITSEGGGVVLNTAAPFVCGHQICMVCAKNFDDVCPTCRETRRFDLINTKAKSSKKPHSGSRRGRR